MIDKNKNLFYLDELPDYKVANNYSDIRGWEILDADKRSIGNVDGLLVNKKAERVVYIDVKANESLLETGYETYGASADKGVHGFLNEDGEDHLIIPIGVVQIDKENKKVLTNEINHETFSKTRKFKKGINIDRHFEANVFADYFPDYATINDTDDGFYNRPQFQNA